MAHLWGAGLAAYTSWAATLMLLTAPGGPFCLFTDYCEEAALRGAQVLAALAPTQHSPVDDIARKEDVEAPLAGGIREAEARAPNSAAPDSKGTRFEAGLLVSCHAWDLAGTSPSCRVAGFSVGLPSGVASWQLWGLSLWGPS